MIKPLPYVYRITHTPSGRFYFGYRKANVRLGLRAEDDIWIKYFTSSKIVRLLPKEECEAFVLAEFFYSKDAELYEQNLIATHQTHPLLINKRVTPGEPPLRQYARGYTVPPEIVELRASRMRGKKRTAEQRAKISKALTGKKVPWTDEHKAKHRELRVGVPASEETRKKLRQAQNIRFQSEEQRLSNRRASIIGYEARKSSLKRLKVVYPNGEIIIFPSAKEFVDKAKHSLEFSKCTIYNYLRKPNHLVTKGPLLGYRFEFLPPIQSGSIVH